MKGTPAFTTGIPVSPGQVWRRAHALLHTSPDDQDPKKELMVHRLELSDHEAPETEIATVSIVVRDARGFTHHYEDFTTSAANAQRALGILAQG